MASCNVRHECDAALALLKDHLEATEMTAETPLLKAAAAIGLGCAYAGSCREDVLELLTLAIVSFLLERCCVSRFQWRLMNAHTQTRGTDGDRAVV